MHILLFQKLEQQLLGPVEIVRVVLVVQNQRGQAQVPHRGGREVVPLDVPVKVGAARHVSHSLVREHVTIGHGAPLLFPESPIFVPAERQEPLP